MDRRRSRFSTQAYSLLRKNITAQKRNLKITIGIVTFPLLVCVLVAVLQSIAKKTEGPANPFGCACVPRADGHKGARSSAVASTRTSSRLLPARSPARPAGRRCSRSPAPSIAPRAPEQRRRAPSSCSSPAPIGHSHRVSQIPPNNSPTPLLMICALSSLWICRCGGNFFATAFKLNISDCLNILPGTDGLTAGTQLMESAFSSGRPLYVLQPDCPPNFTFSIPIQTPMMTTSRGSWNSRAPIFIVAILCLVIFLLWVLARIIPEIGGGGPWEHITLRHTTPCTPDYPPLSGIHRSRPSLRRRRSLSLVPFTGYPHKNSCMYRFSCAGAGAGMENMPCKHHTICYQCYTDVGPFTCLICGDRVWYVERRF